MPRSSKGPLEYIGQATQVALSAEGIDVVRQSPELFVVRNLVLQALCRAVGDMRRFQGALVSHQRGYGWTDRYFNGEKHIANLVAGSDESSSALAKLACSSCPLRRDCGLGPEELKIQILPKGSRRRFNGRLKRGPFNNTHLCATNIAPEHLRNNVP